MGMVKIEITTLLASCLQRMLTTEIDKQEQWKQDDKESGFNNDSLRNEIINECINLQNELEKQGIKKYFNYR